MGFDVSKFIAKVEEFASKLPGSTSKVDGKLDAFEKASLFNSPELQQELKTAVENGEYSAAEANAIFGLELSGAAARRAPGSGEGDGDGDGGNGDGGTGDGNGNVTIIDSGDGGVHITINNSSNWSLTINISTGDAANIEALLNAFLAGIENITQNMLDQLIEFLKKDSDNVFQLLNQLFTLLADNSKLQISTLKDILAALNQLGIKIDGATEVISKLLQAQLEALQESNFKMDALVNLVKENNEKQDEQNEILTMIFDAIGKFADNFGNFSAEIVAKFNALFEMLEKDQVSYDTIIALLTKIQQDTSEGNNISKQILDAVSKIEAHFVSYGDDIKALLTKIATKEVVVNVEGAEMNVSIDIDAILAKLDEIINNTSENQEIQKKILEAINKFGVAITDDLTTIINNMGNDSTKLDALIALMEKMEANNQARHDELIAVIAKLGADVVADLDVIISNMGDNSTKIDALLEFLKTMDANNTENTNKLLKAISEIELNVSVDNLKVNIDVQGIIDAIVNSTGDINTKLDDITKLLNTINNNVVAGNEQNKQLAQDIIDTINKLGYDIANSLNAILEAVGGDTEKLEAILDFLKKMDANAGERNKAILDAIAALGVKVIDALDNLNIDIGDVNLQEVIDAINNNTIATNKQGNNANAWLESIFALITGMSENIGGGGNVVGIDMDKLQEMINNMIVNLHNALSGDFESLMDMLQQILAAIQDHTVKVVVEYNNETGDCNVTTNEGENNNLGALFARSFSSGMGDASAIDNVTTSANPAKAGAKNVLLKGDKYGGLKGQYLIKDNGDGTVDIFNLGGQQVRNHVPKE